MNNTPEADRAERMAYSQEYMVDTEVARKLERKRDEAREDLEHWKIEYEIVVSRLCGTKHERDNGIIAEHEIIPILMKERDEAREQNVKLRDIADTAIEYVGHTSVQKKLRAKLKHDTPETDLLYLNQPPSLVQMTSHFTQFVKKCQQLELERNEAVNELHNIRLHLGAAADGLTLVHAVCVLQQERDEAREDRENSRQSLAFALEELDEARDAAHSFRSLYYAKTGINKGGCAFPWEETK